MANLQSVASRQGDKGGFARYEIFRRIAVGGMAEVFLARSGGLGDAQRVVVLKKIRPELASRREFLEMFLDEARIAATLHHPNIVHLLDSGTEASGGYLAFEHIEGPDLRDLIVAALRREGRVPLEVVLHIGTCLASALQHAHERFDYEGRALHIVHRDISPQNVLVSYEGNVKLFDFGVAKADNRHAHTQSGVLKGKLAYMSPEQCKGYDLDRRSDLFSLGVLLYELTICRRAFIGNSDFEILKRIVETPAPRPRDAWPECPAELDRIITRCLERDPDKRFQTARELQTDLEELARTLPGVVSNRTTEDFLRRIFPADADPMLRPGERRCLESTPDDDEGVARSDPRERVTAHEGPPRSRTHRMRRRTTRWLAALGLVLIAGLLVLPRLVFTRAMEALTPVEALPPPAPSRSLVIIPVATAAETLALPDADDRLELTTDQTVEVRIGGSAPSLTLQLPAGTLIRRVPHAVYSAPGGHHGTATPGAPLRDRGAP